jgi:hypothetical protein
MYNKYKDRAEFLVVYITEAHARDEWPVGKTISFCDQPKTLSERCALARQYSEDNTLTIPVAVDSMNNEFESMFAAWPVRFYVVKDGELVFKAQPNIEHYAYDPTELSKWLKINA